MRIQPLAEDQDSLAFWRTHDRSGRLVAVIGGSIIAAYVVTTWDQPNRGWMLAIALVTAVVPPAVMTAVDVARMVRSPWGAPYYYLLELLGVVIVLTLAWLDGGPTSPLALLLLVLLVHGLGAYPPAGTVLTVGAITGGYLALHVLAGSSPPVTFASTVIVGATAFFGWFATRNHMSVHRHEAAMGRVLRRLADEDGLTGLANRRATYHALATAIAGASPDLPTSVVALDVDRFKAINDARGHLVGDQVLRNLARVLQRASRGTDLVGRLGGDEFLVVLPGTTPEDAEAVAERIHLAVTETEPVFGVSIGVAATGGPAEPDDLLAMADAALYRAKQGGGGRTVTAPFVAAT